MKKFLFLFSLVFSNQNEIIDGVAAVVEEHIILKTDLAQLINMTLVQQRIDPNKDPDQFISLQKNVLQSMVDQKILLEMAEIDSVVVSEKEVDSAIDQQIQNLIGQAGGEVEAERVLGQSIKSFRREYWYDMQERLISERYQQQLINDITISRNQVLEFYKIYKDSLPSFPMTVKIRHIQIPIEPTKEKEEQTVALLKAIKSRIIKGESFSDLASTYSIDPSRSAGGELGWVRRGELVKEFETTAFTLEENTISEPVKTVFGYHLIETLEKKGEKIRVRHILVKPETDNNDNERAFILANTIKDSIKNITNFKKMVKKYSFDKTTKEIGGDLGWITPENYPISEIGKAIKYIDLNSCSPPVNTSFGFHLLWMENIKKGGRPDPKNNWPQLEEMALNKKKMDWYQKWIENARKNFFIKIVNS
mgnify:FL=1|tara:strand:- start:115 stop:1377 length:1263 start_codon:yes stop_codon:yes gene_type:complete